ncbi:hypothetical protein HBB16_21520 [Pseudonocardia sp. MCCB 268]|nr:hypothetical protein [Pseudonocardia cytotoxica]
MTSEVFRAGLAHYRACWPPRRPRTAGAPADPDDRRYDRADRDRPGPVPARVLVALDPHRLPPHSAPGRPLWLVRLPRDS